MRPRSLRLYIASTWEPSAMTEKGQHPPASQAPATRFERRRLLQGLASTGGAAALLATGGASGRATDDPGPATADEADHRRLGFRETQHTRWYYRRARW
jgi:hypothetical protein